MPQSPEATAPEVFVSYASPDHKRVMAVVAQLEAAGVSVWLDRHQIVGGANYGPEIVAGIRACKMLLLMCSDAALASRNVKQEIQIAWKYERPYLPLLLEPISFTEQWQYWLEGCQWVEVLERAPEQYLPAILHALSLAGVQSPATRPDLGGITRLGAQSVRLASAMDGLREIARFTDRIWPLPAERAAEGHTRVRGLGAPQQDVQHRFRLGSRVRLVIESDRAGHLLLLDEGPEGILYCLCPSAFAPDTALRPGRTYLPQTGSRYDAFVVSGRPGREHLLAVVTDEPLGLDWAPTEPGAPARVLSVRDTEALIIHLRALEGSCWTALSTYFDILS